MSPYGIAKKCGEEYLLGWNRIHETAHVPLRFANVYGPRQDAGLEGGVVAIFLERLALAEPTTIFGDGGQSRDFVYVEDVIEAMLATVGRRGGPYNVGTGEPTTIAELHGAAARIAGAETPPTYEDARLGDVHRSVLDVSRIERDLGWRPRVSLADGLQRTWAWMQDRAAA
jgi:UDP-glucose 4-epimerase